MKYLIYIVLLIVIAAPAIQAAAKVNEIPITTSSKEALNSFNKAQHFLDVGRAIEARAESLKAVENDPAFTYGYVLLANSSLSPEEFKQSLEKGMQNWEGKSEGEKLLVQINQTFIDNNAQKRLELAQQLAAKYPESPRAWLTLGFMQGSINHHEDARKSMSKALELDPKFEGAHFGIGFSYLFNEPKDFNKAKRHMEEGIKLDPQEAKGYENLGDVFRALNQLEKARDAYTKAVEKDPNLAVAILKKGHIDSFLGHFDEARIDYDKGIAGAEPVNKINYANFKAFTYIHAGQPKTAVEELQKLVDSADSSGLPKDQTDALKLATLTNEITIALHDKMTDDAQRILDQMRQLTNETIDRVADPNFARQQNAGLILFEGQLAARKGDYQTARSKAEENRKLVEGDSNPRKLEGYYGLLGLTELLQGNNAKAVEDFRKADLTNIYNKYQLAVALDGAGNKQEAKRIFRKVSQWNFNAVGFALVRNDAMKRSV